MKNSRIAIVLFASCLAGCATLDADVRSVSAPTALIIPVGDAPPDAPAEIRPAASDPGQIWVAGYFDYVGGHHVWRAGRYVESKAGYEYVRARYEWNGQVWQFHVPHWKKRQSAPLTNLAQNQ